MISPQASWAAQVSRREGNPVQVDGAGNGGLWTGREMPQLAKMVLLVASTRPKWAAISPLIAKLGEAGAEVVLVSMAPVESAPPDIEIEERSLLRAARAEGPAEFRKAPALPHSKQVWTHLSRDRWTMERARTARVVVALDPNAIYSVWQLAQSLPWIEARYGLQPGFDAFIRDQQDRPQLRQALSTRIAKLRGYAKARGIHSLFQKTTFLRARTRLLLDGRVPEGRRVRLMVNLVSALVAEGRLTEADTLRNEVVARTRSPRLRADFLVGLAMRAIAEGHEPDHLVDAYSAELNYADFLYRSGSPQEAANSMMLAIELAFSRDVHLDSVTSPLASNPKAFTAPLRSSEVLSRVTTPAGRSQPPARIPQDRPVRVLFATHGNTNFVGDLAEWLTERTDVELNVIDLSDLKASAKLIRFPRELASSLVANDQTAQRLAQVDLRPRLDWADVLFIDWCTSLPTLVTRLDPQAVRVVVRLHSYEAFTGWPHLVDWSRVDDLIFVSEHLRAFMVAQVPALESSPAPALHVIPNAVDLQRCVKPKVNDEARFTIAMIGFSVVAKDVLWAVEMLRLLRATDERYRLLLIGGSFEAFHSAQARAYGQRFQEALDELVPTGAIVLVGFTDDIPSALTAAGIVISSSVREGSPVGLLQAAASGAVPVVRDWPFFAATGFGPKSMYPAEWVVDSTSEAADRVLRVSQEADEWRRQSGQASAWAINHHDLGATIRQYESLLLHDR